MKTLITLINCLIAEGNANLVHSVLAKTVMLVNVGVLAKLKESIAVIMLNAMLI